MAAVMLIVAMLCLDVALREAGSADLAMRADTHHVRTLTGDDLRAALGRSLARVVPMLIRALLWCVAALGCFVASMMEALR